MQYLVTGCAGFIGAQVSLDLLNAGHQVIGIDSLNDYYDPNLKKHRLKSLAPHPSFTFYEGSIENKPFLEKIFGSYGFDAVVNLAAMAGVRYSQKYPDLYLSTNIQGTLNLLELMKIHGVRKKVLASTSSLYAGQPTPFHEDLPVNQPLSPYAASKKSAEMYCWTYHHLYNLDVSVLRFFTVYGPAGRPDMSVYRFVQAIDQGHALTIFGDGSQARDFTYIEDIARGVVAALRPTGFEIINLGGGKTPISVNTLIEIIEKNLKKKALIDHKPFHKADMKVTWAEIGKAQKILQWEPQVNIEDGLARTIEWHLREKNWLNSLNNKNVD